ncbi:stage III sporulation protein AF [Aneurinibacillus terranovensis]|uniref:stage III sporulation protein AF n=1 Tax=Aneurinibacillus terranovensis TaxID=278991 RepID=UPI001FE13E67|nr:stage III sporulation protein AF [Aneurinibacillus terranovensis]
MITLWLKRLILLVLMATFLDMLLPNNAYQRYVRLVMGLLILVTLITPILDFFNKGVTVESLASSYGKNNTFALDSARMDALTKQLMSTQDESAERYVEEQVGQAVKKQAEEEYRVQVDSVQVTVNKGPDKEKAPISNITVVLKKSNDRSSEGTTQSAFMKPVDPIKIEIHVGDNGQTHQNSVAAMQTKSLLVKKMESGLTASWNAPVRVLLPGTGEGE